MGWELVQLLGKKKKLQCLKGSKERGFPEQNCRCGLHVLMQLLQNACSGQLRLCLLHHPSPVALAPQLEDGCLLASCHGQLQAGKRANIFIFMRFWLFFFPLKGPPEDFCEVHWLELVPPLTKRLIKMQIFNLEALISTFKKNCFKWVWCDLILNIF